MIKWTLVLAAAISVVAAAPARDDAPSEDPQVIETVDDLLIALETAGRDLTSVQARIYWSRRSELEGDEQVRQGEFYFAQDAPAADGYRRKAFAAVFDSLIIDGIKHSDSYHERVVFDGTWFTQIRDALDDRYYERRRVAPEGQRVDPLILGEGPLPIPIGQTRESILKRYEAELLDPMDGVEDLVGDPSEAVFALGWTDAMQLRLVARDDSFNDSFSEVRLWYDRTTLLPRMARTRQARGGDADSILVLHSVARNVEIPPQVMDTTEPPDGEGWVKNIKEDSIASDVKPDTGEGTESEDRS